MEQDDNNSFFGALRRRDATPAGDDLVEQRFLDVARNDAVAPEVSYVIVVRQASLLLNSSRYYGHFKFFFFFNFHY